MLIMILTINIHSDNLKHISGCCDEQEMKSKYEKRIFYYYTISILDDMGADLKLGRCNKNKFRIFPT